MLKRCLFVADQQCQSAEGPNVHHSYTGWAKKTGPFLKRITPVYGDIGRRPIYQNVQLFIRSKTDISTVAIFKYSLHMFKETILHRKYQLI